MGDEKKCCEKPDQLKRTPQECSAEQIITCHGDAKVHPCVASKGCHDPASLKNAPEACSPEQLKKCHGDAKGHPCM